LGEQSDELQLLRDEVKNLETERASLISKVSAVLFSIALIPFSYLFSSMCDPRAVEQSQCISHTDGELTSKAGFRFVRFSFWYALM